MTETGPAKRRLPLGLLGALLLLLAAILVAAVMIPRRRPAVNADADARSACRAFEDVYAATRPGTPMNGPELARKLEQATGEMRRAASADGRYSSLATSLDELASAVNTGDAPRSLAAMQTIHHDCNRVGAERKA